MIEPDDEPGERDGDDDLDDLDSTDPDLDDLLAHAARAELDSYVPLALRLLEADGDEDRDAYPPGEAIVEATYVLAAASHIAAGDADPVFMAGMSFVLAPERHGFVVRAWRLAAALPDGEVERRVEAARKRARERRAREGS